MSLEKGLINSLNTSETNEHFAKLVNKAIEIEKAKHGKDEDKITQGLTALLSETEKTTGKLLDTFWLKRRTLMSISSRKFASSRPQNCTEMDAQKNTSLNLLVNTKNLSVESIKVLHRCRQN